MVTTTRRLFIDESGDHTYRHLDDLNRRYLALTGVLVRKASYDRLVPDSLERLKRAHFRYDPDDPPILTRSMIVKRKSWFGVLRESARNEAWEIDLIALLTGLQAQIFTVVMDKKVHFEEYGTSSWNPYTYSLSVLLNRVRGYLKINGGTADVMPESRGAREDAQLAAVYAELREDGATGPDGLSFGTGEEYSAAFPHDTLLFRKKEHNVAGLQLADMVCSEQKLLTLDENGRPVAHPCGPFGKRINAAIEQKVNKYGRYLLE
ncbi:MAG: DUF3800 domain-containing protein [Chloroflexi bacterium]|nr:DUF3800 domain-containing protein [Chloroflexota bacterium]